MGRYVASTRFDPLSRLWMAWSLPPTPFAAGSTLSTVTVASCNYAIYGARINPADTTVVHIDGTCGAGLSTSTGANFTWTSMRGIR